MSLALVRYGSRGRIGFEKTISISESPRLVSRVYIRNLAIEHTAYLIEIGFIRKQYSEEHMVFSIG
jgi:hypothetical protein